MVDPCSGISFSVKRKGVPHVTGCINLEDTAAGNKPDTKDGHRMVLFT